MTDQQTKCYYCEGLSKCTNIGLYEGEGGYKKDDTRFRIICGNCYPQINHQGGRSWEIRFKTDDINLQPEFIHKVIKFITDEDDAKEQYEEEVDEIYCHNDNCQYCSYIYDGCDEWKTEEENAKWICKKCVDEDECQRANRKAYAKDKTFTKLDAW